MRAGRRKPSTICLLLIPFLATACRNVGQEMLQPALEAREVQYRDALQELKKSEKPEAPAPLSESVKASAERPNKSRWFSFKWPARKDNTSPPGSSDDPAWWNRRLPPLQQASANPAANVIVQQAHWEPACLKDAFRLGHPIPIP